MQVVHSVNPVAPHDRLVRISEVERLTSFKKTFIYDLVRRNEFPQPVRLSYRLVAWSESAVLQWVQDRIAQTTKEGK